MPKVHKVKARTDRYKIGARIPDDRVKRGYRIDKSKPFDENDKLFCKKGDTYYWFQRYGGPKVETLEYPKRSQLTGSEFLATMYKISENVPEKFESFDDLEQFVEDTKSTLEEQRDELEEKLYNMPFQLQDAPTGELLQNRIDTLDEWINDLESIDFSPDEEEDDWKESYRENNGSEISDEDLDEAWREYLQEQIQAKFEDEVQIEYDGE